MAPEQARGLKGVTTAADVYGLGAVLYELLTGRPPFRADTPLDALVQVLEREPARPRSLDPRIDRDLETVCLKCLEKEPGRRYGTAEAVAEELERWLDGRPIQARPAGQAERLWRWCRRNPLVAGLSAAVVLSLVVGTVVSTIFAFRAESQAERARESESKTATALARTEATLADGLLRPLGVTAEVNVFEWQALTDLACLPQEQARVRPLFIENALVNQRKAGQLDRHLQSALVAAVGTNPDTRLRVIDVAQTVVQDQSRPLSARLVAARVPIELDGEAVALAGPILELAPKADTDQLVELSQLVVVMAKRGDPEAIPAAAGAVAPRLLEIVSADTGLDMPPRLLADLAGYLDREAATIITRRALELVPKVKAHQLALLSGAVADKADPEVSRVSATAVACRALELAPRVEASDLLELSVAVAAVADKGDSEATRATAAAVARRALELLAKAGKYSPYWMLREAAENLAGRLDREAATAVTRRTLELAPKGCAEELLVLSAVVAAAADKGNPEITHTAAAAMTRRALELAPKASSSELRDLSVTVAAVAKKGDLEATRVAAAAVTARALRITSEREWRDWTGDERRFLPETLTAVAGYPDREAAAAVVRETLEPVPEALPHQLEVISGAVAAVADKGDHEGTRAAAEAVSRRTLALLHEALRHDAFQYDGGDVDALSGALHAVQNHVELAPQPDTAAELARRLLFQAENRRPNYNDKDKEVFTSFLALLLRGASLESLVDLLKHPASVGLMREAVLRELGRQHERSFRSVWDAVAWLQQHRPDIDLASPPRLSRDPPPGR
jgi:hypothetical protein